MVYIVPKPGLPDSLQDKYAYSRGSRGRYSDGWVALYLEISGDYIIIQADNYCGSPRRVAYIGVMLIMHIKYENYTEPSLKWKTVDIVHKQNRIECFIIQLWPHLGILLTHLCLTSHKRDSGK